MTRLNLTRWLAIPALLLLPGLVLPTAYAAPPQEEQDVIYLPMRGQPEWLKQGAKSGLRTSAAGQVSISQYGNADALVSNSNGLLAVRFDPPFNAPYTITGISFPSQTQFQIPATPGRFLSLRVQPMDAGAAGTGSLWAKQRAVACTAYATNTLTRVLGTAGFAGVAPGDRVMGAKIITPTYVTAVGDSTVTTDNPVPISTTATVTATFPAPRMILSSSDIPLPRIISMSSDLQADRLISCTATIPAPRVVMDCSATIPPGQFFTLTITRSSGSFVADGVLVGDLVSGPINIAPGARVTAVAATSVTIDLAIFPGFLNQAITFTTTATRRLNGSLASARVGDIVTGDPAIPANTRVASLGAGGAFVVVDKDITTSFTNTLTFHTNPPTARLLAAAGTIGTVRVGDIVTGDSIPVASLVSAISRVNASNPDTVTLNTSWDDIFTWNITFTTPPNPRLVRSSGSFIADGVLVGDLATSPSIPANTRVAAVTATTVTLNQNLTTTFTETVTFTTTAVRRLTRASGSFLTDGVIVGDSLSGPDIPSLIPFGTKVATVTATALTVDKDITGVPTSPITFTSIQPQVRDFLPASMQAGVWLNRVPVSSTGGMNNIPLNIAGNPGQTFFVIFQFPTPPASADSFPFLFTDRNFTDQGLFANSYATDSNAVVRSPAILGTFSGTTLFADQNVVVSMTCQLSGTVPMNSTKNTGLNLRDGAAEWSFEEPEAGILADGEPTTAKTNQVQLVKRDLSWGSVAQAGVGSGRISLPAVPGSGMQIWGTRGLANNGTTSLVSNVTITGPASVVGYAPIAEDADEANGKDTETEAAPVTPPFADRPETVWPAGDIDNYTFYAQPGQRISVTAKPVSTDLRNDMELVVNLLDNGHDLVESAIGAAGGAVSLQHDAAPPSGNSGSKAFKRYFLQVYDRNGSPEGPGTWNRVLLPAGYTLDVDVFTPTAYQLNDDPELSGKAPVADEFSFANTGSNPVRGNANFSYVIPKWNGDASVKLRIYDVKGRLINTLVDGTQAPGLHRATWSGDDRSGSRAGAGTYFARIEAGSFRRTVRIVMN